MFCSFKQKCKAIAKTYLTADFKYKTVCRATPWWKWEKIKSPEFQKNANCSPCTTVSIVEGRNSKNIYPPGKTLCIIKNVIGCKMTISIRWINFCERVCINTAARVFFSILVSTWEITFISNMPVDGHCRVPGCKQLGLYFKRLDQHLRRVHPGISRKMNFSFTVPFVKDRALAAVTDRSCKECTVTGCRFYQVPMARLERHIKKAHPDLRKEAEKTLAETANCSFSDEEHDDNELSSLILKAVNSL